MVVLEKGELSKKAVSGIILLILLTGALTLMLNIRLATSNPETLSIKVTWQQKMDMPTARGYLFRGRSAIGKKIYVIGGWNGSVLDTVEIYNVTGDLWIVGTSLPAPLDDGTVQVVNNKLYVLGGSYPGVAATSTVWEYDPVLDMWASKGPMPTGRRSLASAVVDGKIYTINGVDTGNMISAAVEVYDPATDTWEIKSPHPLPRQYLTAEAVNGKIYTFGGNKYCNKVHEYDPVLDVWTEKSPMPLYISSPNSVTVGDKIFVVGGSSSRDVMIYDPAADSWQTLLDSLPTYRWGALTVEVGGKIYVIGGAGPSGYSAANEEGTISTIPTTPKTIIVPDDYPTIQEAINNASNGDIVYVRQGVYFENIILNKTVSLVGENKTTTIINGNMTGTSVIIKAFNATIKEFTIMNGTNGGLVIFGSSDIVVSNNVITNNHGPKYSYYFSGAGIIAYNSMNCIISENLVSSNDKTAIEIRSSNNITVDANNIDRNGGGIFISGSSGCTLKRNSIIGHILNFGVYGWSLSSYIHDVDSSNKINGKPILYFVNQQNLQIDPATFPEVGYLALINSTDIIVKDFVFKENYQGILLIATNNSVIQNVVLNNNTYGVHSFYSGGNEIINCVASENWEGIFMRYSKTGNIFINLTASNNYEGLFIGDCGYINITNSNISNNEGYGIYLTACYYGENNISHNIIANNAYGIRLGFSPSLLRENMIVNNDVGLWLSYSKNSTIFHNSFMNNIKQVHYEYSTPTSWDDGYPSGGNYWGDYSGLDEKSGPNQDQPGSDGIGDIPYQIPILDTWGRIIGYDYDNYPLMNPWGAGAPTACFTWAPSLPKVGESVTFDASASTPNGGIILNYEWNFGDGETATGKTVTHTYTNSGTYTVTLNVTDSEGLWDTEQKQIQVVLPHGPEAEFTWTPLTPRTGETIEFDASASQPGWNGTHTMPIMEYRWDFGDGNKTTTSTPIIYHSYKTAGNYYVTLTVYAPGATPETDTITYKVTAVSVPVGGYSIPIQVHTKAEPIIPYIALITMLTVIFVNVKRKTRRKR